MHRDSQKLAELEKELDSVKFSLSNIMEEEATVPEWTVNATLHESIVNRLTVISGLTGSGLA